jgi:hypothetical protein
MAAGKPAPPPIGRSRHPGWPITKLPGRLIAQWEIRGGAKGRWGQGLSISLLTESGWVSLLTCAFSVHRHTAFNFDGAHPVFCNSPGKLFKLYQSHGYRGRVKPKSRGLGVGNNTALLLPIQIVRFRIAKIVASCSPSRDWGVAAVARGTFCTHAPSVSPVTCCSVALPWDDVRRMDCSGTRTGFGPDSSVIADWAGLARVGQLHISTLGLQHFGAPGQGQLAWEIRTWGVALGGAGLVQL